ncbi:hypothetical protein QQP08_011669 [Theobroma cacao]|nr:hypothetical protein QQP08_011669 [Theobroma cacao]
MGKVVVVVVLVSEEERRNTFAAGGAAIERKGIRWRMDSPRRSNVECCRGQKSRRTWWHHVARHGTRVSIICSTSGFYLSRVMRPGGPDISLHAATHQ